MSLYADYLRERTKDLILEDEGGFATYRYMDDLKTVYVVDIYTVPAARREGHAKTLVDQIAEKARKVGCTHMIGTVLLGKDWTTTNTKIMFRLGCEIKSATPEYIVFSKEI
jgi:GNAT superfamily N-acetyltransferase